jgi:hypothetical protein
MSEADDLHEGHGPEILDVHGTSHAVEGPHASPEDHGDAGHGHDDHAHEPEALGPIDWAMWGAGVLGVALALVVTACLMAATA